MFAASARLGHPERSFKSVQIAGTNGKGSVAVLLSQALMQSGIRVGLYTSPHLHRFSERIRVDTKEADDTLIGHHLERVLNLNDKFPDLSLTFFEMATLTALCVFAEVGVKWAVLEVGLGGRLDATSIVEPELTAITSIGFDHTDLLGDTLGEIAAEKAGIARPRVPLVAGPLVPPALLRVEQIAKERGAPFFLLGRDFEADDENSPPWPGTHQIQNTAVAFELFKRSLVASDHTQRKVFKQALATVKWPGRFEVIEATPRFILDCAHNLEATLALIEALDLKRERPSVLIFGALQKKPAHKMLKLLRPLVNHVVLVPPPISRALPPKRLSEKNDHVEESIESGLATAFRLSDPNETVLVTGSLFTIAAVRARLLGERTDPPIGL